MKPIRNSPPAGTALSARSLIASLLLRSQPPRMRGARLVQWCGLFGIAEGTARVALSRMVERGELRSADGVYELAGATDARRVAQDWSIAPKPRAWNGQWRFAVVDGVARAAEDRVALRDAMRHVHYGELREGLWTRPDNLPRSSATEQWWSVADAQCTWWSARPDDDPVALAAELFEPRAWGAAADAAARRLEQVTRRLAAAPDDALADAFVIGADALAHVRADPLLPDALVDPAPGNALRAAYATYERAFSSALRTWFRTSR